MPREYDAKNKRVYEAARLLSGYTLKKDELYIVTHANIEHLTDTKQNSFLTEDKKTLK